jgi:hypothetical protein
MIAANGRRHAVGGDSRAGNRCNANEILVSPMLVYVASLIRRCSARRLARS